MAIKNPIRKTLFGLAGIAAIYAAATHDWSAQETTSGAPAIAAVEGFDIGIRVKPAPGGMVVAQVIPNSPAATAEGTVMQEGDVIIGINRLRPSATTEQEAQDILQNALNDSKSAQTELTVERGFGERPKLFRFNFRNPEFKAGDYDADDMRNQFFIVTSQPTPFFQPAASLRSPTGVLSVGSCVRIDPAKQTGGLFPLTHIEANTGTFDAYMNPDYLRRPPAQETPRNELACRAKVEP